MIDINKPLVKRAGGSAIQVPQKRLHLPEKLLLHIHRQLSHNGSQSRVSRNQAGKINWMIMPTADSLWNNVTPNGIRANVLNTVSQAILVLELDWANGSNCLMSNSFTSTFISISIQPILYLSKECREVSISLLSKQKQRMPGSWVVCPKPHSKCQMQDSFLPGISMSKTHFILQA